jgi:hypothetical protein
MRRAWLLLGCCAALAWTQTSARAGQKEEGKGTEVKIDGLKSRTPADWVAEKSSNRFRAFQFKVPHAEGDKNDAQVVVFFFGEGSGGSAEDNVKRWKGMFEAPEGKTIEDVSKVEKMKVSGVNLTYLDVQGTYLDKFPPFDPRAKTTRRPDYRMLGVVFESPNGPYFIRLTGPARTVAQHKKGFDEWLRAFK